MQYSLAGIYIEVSLATINRQIFESCCERIFFVANECPNPSTFASFELLLVHNAIRLTKLVAEVAS